MFNAKAKSTVAIAAILGIIYVLVRIAVKDQGEQINDLLFGKNGIFSSTLGTLLTFIAIFIVFLLLTYVYRLLAMNLGVDEKEIRSGKIDLHRWKFQLAMFGLFCLLMVLFLALNLAPEYAIGLAIVTNAVVILYGVYRRKKQESQTASSGEQPVNPLAAASDTLDPTHRQRTSSH